MKIQDVPPTSKQIVEDARRRKASDKLRSRNTLAQLRADRKSQRNTSREIVQDAQERSLARLNAYRARREAA